MKAVIVDEETFDREFELCVSKLNHARFESMGVSRESLMKEGTVAEGMFRAMNYEIRELQNRLKKVR